MRSTVNITAQAEAVQCLAKTTGVAQECQFTGLSIAPFFAQPEKIDVVVKCNDDDITSKITFIDIDLSVNQVGICTLSSPNVSGFKVNDVIEVEFIITGYGQVKVFYGYIDRIEKNHLNQGQIICADILRDLRDGVLTQIISEFTPETRSNYIGVVFSTQPILPFLLSDYSINATIEDTHRELSFGNANKLTILQKLAEEYNLVFWVDYQNNKVVFKTVDSSDTFLLPLEHSFTITDRSKANTGVKVIYEYHDEQLPEERIEQNYTESGGNSISTYSKYLGGTLIYESEITLGFRTSDILSWWDQIGSRTFYASVGENRITFTTVNSGYRNISESITAFGTISKTVETQIGDENLRIISRSISNYGFKEIYGVDAFVEISRIWERWNWDAKTYTYYEYGWSNIYGVDTFTVIDNKIQRTGEDEFISIPTSDIKTDEKSVLVGSEVNPIYVYTSYISYEDEAKALADWLAQTELQGKEINIDIRKIIPTLKPGNYVTSNDFDGSCFIETVNHQYDLKNRNCITSISGVLLDV